MSTQSQKIEVLYKHLINQPKESFPAKGKPGDVPKEHGVYVIRKNIKILHVGRTQTAKDGLQQRLYNHLTGSSSFTIEYLKRDGKRLRSGHTYQYLIVKNPRNRALLEAYATGKMCPAHLGLGK